MDVISSVGGIMPPKLKNFFRKIFKKPLDKRHERKVKERREIYHKCGLEALQKFDECMRKNNFKYILAFGSMLGAVREHGFIKHDLDIDTWMFIENDNERLVPELKKYGFNLLYYYSIDNDKYGKEYTFDYKGCHVDIFFIYPAIDKYPYCTDYYQEKGMKRHEKMPRRLQLPISKQTKLVKFETLELPIPINAEEICEFRYGKDYMTPNPQWNWLEEKNNVIEWREMIPKTTHKVYSIN